MTTRSSDDARLLSGLVAGGLLLVLSLLASVVLAGPARAHTGLVEATPGAGATVAAPTELVLTFSEELLPSLAVVTLQGPSGAVALTSGPEVSGRRVVQALGALEAGEHQVRYRVVAGDGHPVAGETAFTVRAAPARPAASRSTSPAAAAPAAPTPPTAAAAGGDSSPTPAIAGVLLVVLGGAALVARRRAVHRPEAA